MRWSGGKLEGMGENPAFRVFARVAPGVIAALVAAIVAVGVVACDGGPEEDVSPSPTAGVTDTPRPGEPLTLDGVYEGLEEALRTGGDVTRFDVAVGGMPAAGVGPSAFVVWVAADGERGRREFGELPEGEPDRYISIATEEGAFTLGPNASISVDERTCPGAGPAVAMLLDCPNREFETYVFENGSPVAHTEQPTVIVTETTFEGAPAVLVEATKDVQPYRSSPYRETQRIYLDRVSLLPLRREVTQDPGQTEVFTYAAERVPQGDLDAGFFEPESLVAMRQDPVRTLEEATLDVLWPGATTPEGDAPPLTLWHASRYRSDEADPSTEQVMLEYVRSDDTYGQTLLLRLTEYTREEWERRASQVHAPSDPCWVHETVALEDGTLEAYSGYSWPDSIPAASEAECPADRERDRFLGFVTRGDTVVVIEPWQWPEQSRAGIEEIARRLEPLD